jgi:hypothetical protein
MTSNNYLNKFHEARRGFNPIHPERIVEDTLSIIDNRKSAFLENAALLRKAMAAEKRGASD